MRPDIIKDMKKCLGKYSDDDRRVSFERGILRHIRDKVQKEKEKFSFCICDIRYEREFGIVRKEFFYVFEKTIVSIEYAVFIPCTGIYAAGRCRGRDDF